MGTHTAHMPAVAGSVDESIGLPRLREAWADANGGVPVPVGWLSRGSGVGRSTLFAWLCGTVAPTAAAWAAVCEALGADPVAVWVAAGGTHRGPLWAQRLRRGWSAGQLADRARVSKRTVLCAESGEPVRCDAAARLARTLGCPELLAALAPAPRAGSRTGALLEQARISAGQSRTQFAHRLGISRQLLSAWCAGSEVLPAARVPAVATAAGLDPELVALARAADSETVRVRRAAQRAARAAERAAHAAGTAAAEPPLSRRPG